ncbi:hypothetical protein JW868_02855 [Candidatus Woesearchaeota archaeon]|nr:hypothetical protein [Candidatus Woesearchaeota archaeon]
MGSSLQRLWKSRSAYSMEFWLILVGALIVMFVIIAIRVKWGNALPGGSSLGDVIRQAFGG